MDIVSLLLSCSMHADDALLQSIAYVTSRGNPYAVLDLSGASDVEDEYPPPRSLEAARSTVGRIAAGGGVALVGILPVRSEWAVEFSKTPEDLFDPCSAVAIVSAKLSEFDYECRARKAGTARRACVLESYGRSLSLPGLERAVLADLSLSVPFTAAVEPDDALSTSGGMGLFFSVPAEPAPITGTRPLEPIPFPIRTEAEP